jgi:hypothetical protein
LSLQTLGRKRPGFFCRVALAERTAALGESIQSYFDTEPLCAKMRASGFRNVDDIGPERIAARFFPQAERSAPARGGHIMHASKV